VFRKVRWVLRQVRQDVLLQVRWEVLRQTRWEENLEADCLMRLLRIRLRGNCEVPGTVFEPMPVKPPHCTNSPAALLHGVALPHDLARPRTSQEK